MNSNIGKALVSFSLAGAASFGATFGCSAEDPAPSPTGGQSATTMGAGTTGGAVTATAAGPAVGGTNTVTSGDVATATTGAATTGAATTGAATTGAATTGTATTGTATTEGVTSTAATGAGGTSSTSTTTTGGAMLTDAQCQGISSNAMCTTPGECAPRACGIADTGTRTCTCATTWDCTSCAWTEPYSPYAEPPTEALPACSGVTEGAACTDGDPRCMMGGELCVCFVEDGSVWDCDNPPSFWE